MSELTIALITIFGTVASVSGILAYVFNGTRKLIQEMHATTKEMHATTKEMHATTKAIYETIQEMHREAEQRHREVIEWFKRSDERVEERHKEVIEFLKKGFGEVLQHQAT